MPRWWNGIQKGAKNITVGQQARYNRLNAAAGATEDALERLETGTGGSDGLIDLEHNHEEALARNAEAEAAHAEAKAAFAPIDAENKRLAGQVKAFEGRIDSLTKAKDAAEKAHTEHQAKIADIRSRVGSNTIEELAHAEGKAEDSYHIARGALRKAQAKLPDGTTVTIDDYFKNAKQKYTEAKRKYKSAIGTPREGAALNELGDARQTLLNAREIRRAQPEYGEWKTANTEYGSAKALCEEGKTLNGLEAKSGTLEKAAEQARTNLTESPDHAKLTEARSALGTHTTEVHAPAAKEVENAKKAIEGPGGTKEELGNAEHALKSTTRQQELLQGRLERQTKRVEEVGKKWRIGKAGKAITTPAKLAWKGVKWGGLGAGVAAAGALAYAALKPSERGGSDESLQSLKDQMAENEAKLQAMQAMQAQQQPVMQAPMMVAATPQGPVATQYPPVMMVPANTNVPATSITGAGIQYQGQLAAMPGMGVGAPA